MHKYCLFHIAECDPSTSATGCRTQEERRRRDVLKNGIPDISGTKTDGFLSKLTDNLGQWSDSTYPDLDQRFEGLQGLRRDDSHHISKNRKNLLKEDETNKNTKRLARKCHCSIKMLLQVVIKNSA